jgi:hypothetical protein
MKRALLLAAFLAAACHGRTPPTGDIIVVALANAPTNLDPGVGLDESLKSCISCCSARC